MKLRCPASTRADRCINCNTVCESCVSVCPNRANVAIAVPGKEMRQILHVDYILQRVRQLRTLLPLYRQLEPYKDKFTLFANEKDFGDSGNNGFMVVCTKCLVKSTSRRRGQGNTPLTARPDWATLRT